MFRLVRMNEIEIPKTENTSIYTNIIYLCKHKPDKKNMIARNQKQVQSYLGHIIDIENQRITKGEIITEHGLITQIIPQKDIPKDAPYYLPGLCDAHIHIESTMMTPRNFASIAVQHGVTTAICDPHEITNVLGVEGIDFMTHNARGVRYGFYFGLPSCVPSSHLETAGATINAQQTQALLERTDLHFLAEMMNFPGVLSHDPEVMAKISAAKKAGKPIDGHAPQVHGKDLEIYAQAGISTDHECATLSEARERIENGMKVIVREGSAARNFEALYPIIDEAPHQTMLCSDDKHPDDLLQGHIDQIIRRGLVKGLSIWNLLRAASLNPTEHYGLKSANLKQGDAATFIAVKNLEDFDVLQTVIDGYEVYNAKTGVDPTALYTEDCPTTHPNNFEAQKIAEADLDVRIKNHSIKVIEAFDGELFTKKIIVPYEELQHQDIQKIVVYNRYGNGSPRVGFIKGFQLQDGAIGATIAHDSHNIIAIGQNDHDLVQIINALINEKGGVGVAYRGKVELLRLPIAGLMTDMPAEQIASEYAHLNTLAKELGCTMHAPFITMAFMALPVIPELKLTDKGLVDVAMFDFCSLTE